MAKEHQGTETETKGQGSGPFLLLRCGGGKWFSARVISSHKDATEQRHECERVQSGHPEAFSTPLRFVLAASAHHLNAQYLDSIMPDVTGMFDGDLVEIVITAKAVRDIRAAIAKAEKGH